MHLRWIGLLVILAIGLTADAMAVQAKPHKPVAHKCARVTIKGYKATGVVTTDVGCGTVRARVPTWIKQGSRTLPHDAKRWHARGLGRSRWMVRYGKSSQTVAFTLTKLAPPPPPPPLAAPTITSGPPSRTNLTNAIFVFMAKSGSSFRCKLDAGAFVACGVGEHVVSYGVLTDGQHTFVVQSVGAGGRTADSAPYVWRVSTQGPPQPSVSASPRNSPNNSSSMTFSFADSQPGVGFRCSLDGGAYSACSSPRPYNGLGNGVHTFSVQAQDDLGNVSAVGVHSWVTDTTPPTILDPTVPTNGQAMVAGTAVNASYACADNLDAPAQLQCKGTVANGSPIDTGSLGAKPFSITATDRAGNSTTADLSYTVGGNLPAITISSPSDGAALKWGETVNAGYACVPGGSLQIKSCTATVSAIGTVGDEGVIDKGVLDSGSTLPTTGEPGPGTRTLTVTAVDSIGQTSTKTITYTVAPTGYYGLTFDDGPNDTFTQPLLNELSAAHAHATFFLIGQNVVAQPELAQAEVQAGMSLGDHTWDHSAVTNDVPPDPSNPPVSLTCPAGPHTLAQAASRECVPWQIEDTSDAIFNATGVHTQWFRPPYGYYDQGTVDLLARLPAPYSGMSLTAWRADTNDWNGASTDQIVAAAFAVPAGGLILMHDAQQTTVSALPTIISRMATERGLLPGKLAAVGSWHGPFCGQDGGGDACPPPYQPDYHVSAVAP